MGSSRAKAASVFEWAACRRSELWGAFRVEVVVRLGGCPDEHAIVSACLPSISPSTVRFFYLHITNVSGTRRGFPVEIAFRKHSWVSMLGRRARSVSQGGEMVKRSIWVGLLVLFLLVGLKVPQAVAQAVFGS